MIEFTTTDGPLSAPHAIRFSPTHIRGIEFIADDLTRIWIRGPLGDCADVQGSLDEVQAKIEEARGTSLASAGGDTVMINAAGEVVGWWTKEGKWHTAGEGK